MSCINNNDPTFVARNRGRESESGVISMCKEYIFYTIKSSVSCVLDVLDVPQGDIQFLLSPATAVAAHGGHINSESSSALFSSADIKAM